MCKSVNGRKVQSTPTHKRPRFSFRKWMDEATHTSNVDGSSNTTRSHKGHLKSSLTYTHAHAEQWFSTKFVEVMKDETEREGTENRLSSFRMYICYSKRWSFVSFSIRTIRHVKRFPSCWDLRKNKKNISLFSTLVVRLRLSAQWTACLFAFFSLMHGSRSKLLSRVFVVKGRSHWVEMMHITGSTKKE